MAHNTRAAVVGVPQLPGDQADQVIDEMHRPKQRVEEVMLRRGRVEPRTLTAIVPEHTLQHAHGGAGDGLGIHFAATSEQLVERGRTHCC